MREKEREWENLGKSYGRRWAAAVVEAASGAETKQINSIIRIIKTKISAAVEREKGTCTEKKAAKL